MSTPEESAIQKMVRESYEASRAKRKTEIKEKRAKGQYASGKKIIEGKTQKQTKAENKAHSVAFGKALDAKAKSEGSHTSTPHTPKKTFLSKHDPEYLYGWAGAVAKNRVRNQKSSPNSHYHDKGYREDYR